MNKTQAVTLLVDPTSTIQNATRIDALDALRGIALLGILFVNFSFFAMPNGSFGSYIDLAFPGRLDRWAQFLTEALCDGKFILLFSFLFGWGFNSQLQNRDDSQCRARFFRRLLGLLTIGLLHACFLFVGDILVTYALLGIPLYWVRHWSPSRLVVAASVMWLVSVFGHMILGFLPITRSENMDVFRETLRIHTEGTIGEIIWFRIQSLVGLYLITPLLFMPQVFGMFLVGLASAKHHARSGMERLQVFARFVLVAFWSPAIVGNLAYPWLGSLADVGPDTTLGILALGGRALFAPMLSLVYLSVAAKFLTHPAAGRWTRFLAGEGRSTLSLYIGESIVMGFLFNSYGLAWYGKIGPAFGIGVCIVVYCFLLVIMNTWLRYFRMGPFEWMLRCITEWKWITIRIIRKQDDR
jgi:uncharacterized protein